MAQGLLQLPTTGTVSGLQNNQDANAALAALAAMVQGGAAPTPASTGLAATSGVLWHDTTNNQLKLRDQADANWMPFATVDEASKLVLLLLRSYLAGLTLANDGTAPTTKIDVAAGVCADDTNVAMLSLPSGGAIDCTTTGAGGLDAGSLAASTWYHAFAIAKPGGASPALLASTSLASPAFPSGYTLKRRIGSFKTDASAHILGFQQNGDYFRWLVPTLDANNAAFVAGYTLQAITVPPGVVVEAFGNLVPASGSTFWQLRPAFASDGNPSSTASPGMMGTGGGAANITGTKWFCRTNASQQLSIGSSGANLYLTTEGWIDFRGRLN